MRAQLRAIQPRTKVFIDLYPQDIVAVVTQNDVLKNFTEGELETILEAVSHEHQDRQVTRKEKENDDNATGTTEI